MSASNLQQEGILGNEPGVHPLVARAPSWVDPETVFKVREVADRWSQESQILNETGW